MPEFEFLTIPEKFSSLDIISYQYFNQLLNHRTVVFNSEISENIIESLYLPLKDFENDDIMEPVTIILNSVGGSVSDGFFLANYLTTYKKPVNLYVMGYAASMAFVVLAACGKNPNITRYCYPSSYFLCHDGYVAISPSESKTAADIMEWNDKVDRNIRDFIIKNTNITEELYDSKTRKQWFITAQEGKELGLIDIILE
jgi:ATP-dependent Clp protease protease subunit